jgi:cytidine deaminase
MEAIGIFRLGIRCAANDPQFIPNFQLYSFASGNSGVTFLSSPEKTMKEFTFYDHLEDLDAESKYLVHKAKEAAGLSYAPYSRFHVGAALILEDGTVVAGANQENASYPLCLCAERVALGTAATQHPKKKIAKLAVVAFKKNHKEISPATCCGACRQVMLEAEVRQAKPFEVIMLGNDGRWIRGASAASLIPFAFTLDS